MSEGHNNISDRRALLAGLGGLAAGAFAAGSAQAGSLTPPAAPAPTMKSLNQVEPRTAINAENTPGNAGASFRITQPGSYYLTGNLTGASARRGIEVTANDVTIDLNGFALIGVAGALAGIQSTGTAVANLSIRNGTIRSWPQGGINASNASGAEIRDLIVSNCTNSGIRFDGEVIITRTVARSNTGSGISVNRNAIFTDCIAHNNTSNGIAGGDGCSFTSCSARENGGAGFVCNLGGTFLNCTARANSLSGFSSSEGSSFTNCVASGNNGNGFTGGFSNTFSQCTARTNGQDGFNASRGSLVIACTAGNNTLSGIRVSNDCTVRDCYSESQNSGSSSAGIRCTSQDNRIEGNHFTDNRIGLRCEMGGNLIIRNTARNNIDNNYSLAANNKYGPIVFASNQSGVSGNTSSGSVGSSDPWANITF